MPAVATRPVIRKLSPLVINQIAAGEVIERPASVVKEVVENAIDAGATRVTVELAGGGIDLVRVTDDGCGLLAGDLPMAVEPHATSKLESPEQLDRIATLGFRGEALASIASVSRVVIRSRVRGGEGHEVAVDGGVVSGVRPAASGPGTCVEVRELFFNTPARRKFLKTVATEQSRCVEWLRDLAMAHPGIGFVCRVEGGGEESGRVGREGQRVLLDVPAGQSPRERAVDVLGRELDGQLIEVGESLGAGVTIWGLVGTPELARPTNKHQHVFLNGRAIRDKTIQHALREAYRGLIDPSRHPTAVLMIEVDPSRVDVNVHPAKLEVRFRDSSAVHQAVLHAVREGLRSRDLTPGAAGAMGPAMGAADRERPFGAGLGSGGGGSVDPQRRVAEFVEFFRSAARSQTQGTLGIPASTASGPSVASAGVATTVATPPAIAPADEAGPMPGPMQTEPARGPMGQLPATPMVARPTERLMQVHNSYVVAEDEQGLVIIDQHALHERAMFERLYERVLGDGRLEPQRLLTPVAVPASEGQLARLEEMGPLLERLGIDAQPLGPRTLGVHSFPSLLFERGVDPVPFVGDLLARLDDGAFMPGTEEALHEVLDMMACKASVRAGDQLSGPELGELVRMRERIERSASCPHGRPTAIRLTMRDLERLFHRS